MDSQLIALRQEIDEIDKTLLSLLSKRFAVVNRIGKHKKRNALAAFDPNRWGEVLSSRIALGGLYGLREEFVKAFFTLVHKESIFIEQKETRI